MNENFTVEYKHWLQFVIPSCRPKQTHKLFLNFGRLYEILFLFHFYYQIFAYGGDFLLFEIIVYSICLYSYLNASLLFIYIILYHHQSPSPFFGNVEKKYPNASVIQKSVGHNLHDLNSRLRWPLYSIRWYRELV